jgi:hypothetical protein
MLRYSGFKGNNHSTNSLLIIKNVESWLKKKAGFTNRIISQTALSDRQIRNKWEI